MKYIYISLFRKVIIFTSDNNMLFSLVNISHSWFHYMVEIKKGILQQDLLSYIIIW